MQIAVIGASTAGGRTVVGVVARGGEDAAAQVDARRARGAGALEPAPTQPQQALILPDDTDLDAADVDVDLIKGQLVRRPSRPDAAAPHELMSPGLSALHADDRRELVRAAVVAKAYRRVASDEVPLPPTLDVVV